MHPRITADEKPATFPAAQVRHDRAKDHWFADLVKNLWPVKGPAAIEQYTRCPDRTARAYSSGDREPPASVLRDLLRGDEGYRVLTFVMSGYPVTWWIVIQHERAVYARLRELSPALQGIINDVSH